MLERLRDYEVSGHQWELYLIALIVVVLILGVVAAVVSLSRSVEVTESGKVVVRYHPPTAWVKRFNAQLADSRAGYTDRQKKILSFMTRGSQVLQAFSVFLFGFLLSGMGVFLLVDNPMNIKDVTTVLFLIIGLVFLGLAIWLFVKVGADDPYR